jgi:hypothetical protein
MTFEEWWKSGRPDEGSYANEARVWAESGWTARQPEVDALKEELRLARNWGDGDAHNAGVLEAGILKVLVQLRAQVQRLKLTADCEHADGDPECRPYNCNGKGSSTRMRQRDQLRAQVDRDNEAWWAVGCHCGIQPDGSKTHKAVCWLSRVKPKDVDRT